MPRRSLKQNAGLKEVAAAAGVSLMTVSRALRGVDGVSESKRAQIVEIAARLNYMPNSAARSLSRTNSDLVGISLPTLNNDVFADMLYAMRAVFRHAGYATVVDTTEYDVDAEYAWVERLLGWQPAAVVLTGHNHHPDTVRVLKASGVPTLETWGISPTPIDVAVGLDHAAAGEHLGRHLIDLGYRRPAYVGAPSGYDPRAEERLRGLQTAFADWQDPHEWVLGQIDDLNPYASGDAGLRQVLQTGSPDIVFFLNDLYAMGGVSACRELGVSVPQELGLVGFNALNLTAVLDPKLTTMATPRAEIGRVGARRLLARINGLDAAGAEVIEATIVQGGTTRDLRET